MDNQMDCLHTMLENAYTILEHDKEELERAKNDKSEPDAEKLQKLEKSYERSTHKVNTHEKTDGFYPNAIAVNQTKIRQP